MRKDDEHKQQAKHSGRNDKEIGGDQIFDVIAQEGTPRLGRRVPVPNHVLGNRCLGDFDAQLAQLAVNAWCTPAKVGGADASNQIPHLGHYRRTTMTWTTLPTSIQPKALRCHAITVSGFTMRSAEFQSALVRESQTQRRRSKADNVSRRFWLRRWRTRT
jgi:hypothetical protein